jgi:hypothetical protein
MVSIGLKKRICEEMTECKCGGVNFEQLAARLLIPASTLETALGEIRKESGAHDWKDIVKWYKIASRSQ